MSDFQCPVVRVKIEEHPNADAIEIARVGDFQSIVKKGQFKDGDLAVYIPESAVLPQWLLKDMGFWDEFKGKGMLSGSLGNRVKAIKLRGVLSQGLVLGGNLGDDPNPDIVIIDCETVDGVTGSQSFNQGDDAAEWLGVTKWAPPIPSHMQGRVVGVDLAATTKYDFENIKKNPDLFEDGEEVVITEKIHGTLLMVGCVPHSMKNERYYKGRIVISSKGMGAKGWILDHNDPTNLYAQAVKKHGILDAMYEQFAGLADAAERPFFIFGEVFGRTESGAGVQDLTYSDETLAFRAFDACMGSREQASYFKYGAFVTICEGLKLPTVPVLYRGPFSKEVLLGHTDGNTTLTDRDHIREGVVVKSAFEIKHPKYGRKIAKSISEKYLLRKGNTTEFN